MSSSRESYQLPSSSSQPQNQSSGAGSGGYSGFSVGAAAGESSTGPAVSYVCGECSSKVELQRGDAIRCNVCGHRVLYKERTKRMVQFEAR